MADTLHINSGGSPVVDFDDPNSPYSLKWGGWAPKVANIIYDGMGNKSVYEDVDEEMTITIKGATASAIMASAEVLVALVNQGKLWFDGRGQQGDPAIEIVYEVSDSLLTNPLQTYIIGPPSSGPIIAYPNHFDAIEDGLSLSPVKLRFKRDGAWYGDVDTKTHSAVTQNGTAAITFDDLLSHPCPFTLQLDGMNTSNAPMQNCALLLSDADEADTLEYKDGSGGTKISASNTYAAFNDSANDARDNFVGRITASAVKETVIRYTLDTSIDQQLIGVFAVMRVNNSARNWTLFAYSKTGRGHTNGASRPKIVLDGADSTQPQVIFLGYLFSPLKTGAHSNLFVNMVVDSISGSPTFDIDCIVAIGLDKQYSRTLTLLPTDEANNLNYLFLAPYDDESANPFAYAYGSASAVFMLDWRGDMWLCSTGNKASGFFLATRGSAWVWTNSGGVPFAFDWTWKRTKTYLTPQ